MVLAFCWWCFPFARRCQQWKGRGKEILYRNFTKVHEQLTKWYSLQMLRGRVSDKKTAQGVTQLSENVWVNQHSLSHLLGQARKVFLSSNTLFIPSCTQIRQRLSWRPRCRGQERVANFVTAAGPWSEARIQQTLMSGFIRWDWGGFTGGGVWRQGTGCFQVQAAKDQKAKNLGLHKSERKARCDRFKRDMGWEKVRAPGV